MKYLVTGAAGFIGNLASERLCEQGHEEVVLDNLNAYYYPQLKHCRLKRIEHLQNLRFVKMELTDRNGIANLFLTERFKRFIYLAAQTVMRYSQESPMVYSTLMLLAS